MSVFILVGSKARQAGIMLSLCGMKPIRVSDKYFVAAEMLGTTPEEMWECHHALYKDTTIAQHPVVAQVNDQMGNPSKEMYVIYDTININMLQLLKSYFNTTVIGVGTVTWGASHCQQLLPNVTRLREVVNKKEGSRVFFVAKLLNPSCPEKLVDKILPRVNSVFRLEALEEFYCKARDKE